MNDVLGIMVTFTTYGTWLRGDRRGWIDDGRLIAPNSVLEAADRGRLKHPPFRFGRSQLLTVGAVIGRSITTRLQVPLFALHVGTWHVHAVLGVQPPDIPAAVKCAKDAVRFALRPSRPIWTTGYDMRYCFNRAQLGARIRYVQRHNEAMSWPAQPWDFLTPTT